MKEAILESLQTLRSDIDQLTRLLYDDWTRDEAPQEIPEGEPEDEQEYLSVHDVARRFGISSATVYRWARDGLIPKGRQWGPRTRRWRADEIKER